MYEQHEGIVRTAIALRTLADALLAQLGVTATTEQPAPAPSCEHPPAQRRQRAAFGQNGEHWTCGVCGYEYDDDGVTEALDGR